MMRVTRRAAIAFGMGGALVAAAAAFAATPVNSPSPQAPGSRAGAFYNYDYTSTTCAPPSSCTNVDWPVTMIFKGSRATIASVTKLLQNAGYGYTGSTEFAYVEQSGASAFQQVSNGGPKRFISTPVHPLVGGSPIGVLSSVHIRLYAPPAGYFSGSNGVHYVIGTPHFDLNELFSPTYGWSEVAAEQVAADLVASKQVDRSAIAYDSVPLRNPEGTPSPTPWLIIPRKDGTHYWQSSGYATVVALDNVIRISAAGSIRSPQGAIARLSVTATDSAQHQVLIYRALGLPARLTINTSTGLITGRVVAAPGSYVVRVVVSDSSGARATKLVIWHVLNDIVLTPPRAQSTPPNHRVHLIINARDLIPHRTLHYAATGLPAGLAINGKTGVVSGRTANTPRVYAVTVVVTDSGGAKARARFIWKV